MKLFIVLLLSWHSMFAFGQTAEELKYMDTLSMGGSYLLGKPLPKFECVSVKGKKITNENLKNKITVLNFWFKSCAPCLAETVSLNELYRHFRPDPGFQFISFTWEKKKDIKKFARRHKIKYPVFSLPLIQITELLFKKGYPTTIITDATGKIIYFETGGSSNPEVSKNRILTELYPILTKQLK